MRMVIDINAKDEMRDAALYYENQRKGLGQDFLDEIETAFNQVKLYPEMWRIMKGKFRRYLTNRFPYAVIYVLKTDVIYVAAIMHTKRKPDYWLNRVKYQSDH